VEVHTPGAISLTIRMFTTIAPPRITIRSISLSLTTIAQRGYICSESMWDLYEIHSAIDLACPDGPIMEIGAGPPALVPPPAGKPATTTSRQGAGIAATQKRSTRQRRTKPGTKPGAKPGAKPGKKPPPPDTAEFQTGQLINVITQQMIKADSNDRTLR